MRNRWRHWADGLRRLSKDPRTLLLVAFGALFLFALAFRIALIHEGGAYCRHTDEQHWTRSAINILRTGDLNPHRFTKPSVMVYLNVAAFTLGLVRAGAKGEALHMPQQLSEHAGYPYYQSLTMIETARYLYAFVSVAAMLLAVLLVRRLSNSSKVALLALVLMLSSSEYLQYSWHYLNVDILGCFFVMAAVAYALLHRQSSRPAVVLAISGVLSGLVIGTKYNLFPIVVPTLALVFIHYRERWFSLSVWYFVVLVLTFLATTPYALLDLPSFVQQAAHEAYHYGTGHAGKPLSAGLPMTWRYLDDVLDSFSPLVLAFGLYGLVQAFVADYRRATIAFSFPIILLAYMSAQSTFFARNLLVLHLFVPMWAALGLAHAFQTLRRLLAKRFERLRGRRVLLVTTLILAVPVLATTPYKALARAYDLGVESRIEAASWIRENVPEHSEVLVPQELNMDVARLASKYTVVQFAATKTSLAKLRKKHRGAVVLVPKFAKRYEKTTLQRGPGKVLAKFGRTNITLEKYRNHQDRRLYTPSGNPKLYIVQL